MAHNKKSVSSIICLPPTKDVWKIEIGGEFNQPTLNINTHLTICFQANFYRTFDFPDMNLDM